MADPRRVTDSQVKKAGRTLRRYMRGDAGVSAEMAMGAKAVAQEFRALHQVPLGKANMGLRSMVATAGCGVEVTQRMKRWSTILDKLQREPQLPLNKMQDIGGCRAILASIDEIRRVEERLIKNRPVTSRSDYVEVPRTSGYRAVHVVVLYDSRQIEIQLRTRAMHEWAITVERLASRTSLHLKSDGTHAIQLLMSSISEAMAIEEVGGTVNVGLESLIRERRLAADPFLRGER